MRIGHYLMTFCFLLVLAVPTVDTFGRWSLQSVWTANRARATFPQIKPRIKSVAAAPRKLDSYFEDNFGFRDQFIQWNNEFKVHWLHQSPVSDVMIGTHGWLYFAFTADGIRWFDRRWYHPIPEAELEARRKSLEQHQAELAAHGIPFVFVIAPNKETIYPEYLPLTLANRGRGPRIESLVRYMREHSSVPVLDLSTDMLQAKNDKIAPVLYFSNDTHWNYYGGFVGYRTIMKHLMQLFPQLHEVTLDDFTVREGAHGGDLAVLLGMAAEFPSTEYFIEPKPTMRPPAPLRAVMVGDSFSWVAVSFLRYSFAHVGQHLKDEGGFKLERILAERPDVVVELHVERQVSLF